MLVELDVVEQRYRAVLEVLDGAAVTQVAARYGVVRQTVHEWLRRYAGDGGLGGLADRPSRPHSCPHQMKAAVEAVIVAMRRSHPGWGPATIRWHLERDRVNPMPSRSAIYRALVRHGLVDPKKRRRKREDYRRWERGRSMELWQLDVMGRVHLADGTEVKLLTGLDDHSRFCVCAKVLARATARPVCQAFADAMRRHGVPDQALTDNGKVFTGRFGRGVGEVLFDRVCRENGIRHLLTAPHSPTTTGKIERFHKTLRREFLAAHDGKHASIEELQAALDGWVAEYNTARPHQSIGQQPPVARFALAERLIAPVDVAPLVPTQRTEATTRRPGGVSRWVDPAGKISVAGFRYPVGAVFAGEPVEVLVTDGLVEVLHRGALIATHAQRLRTDHVDRTRRVPAQRRPRDPTSGMVVTRRADNSGTVSFAGAAYQCGRRFARTSIDVSIVAGSVQLAQHGKVIRVHPIRHDRSRELGAFANPKGRPRQRSSSA